ncbi:hypothetical protein PVK63_09425 [Aliivibrio sp. S2TY2]|uniref:hypothetical protein n=1 Tax=unclassified Aliivibrio TaxID=2645654 RepID=UPI0023787991|nr:MULTISPECIES: hypothetical protein [unclassified Aliivibrio]MDD9174882.1 hypothetical protein [Aliivibrio sp. S3TY1]MDD9192171.1 hypothetical protein [Aliivibrio sp. S2TY2]
MINIREKDKATLISIAQKTLCKNTKVWAYASRVKQTNHEASDLDIVLITPTNMNNDLIEFKEALQNSNIPIFIQVLEWANIPQSFQENILHKYEELYVVI